jgi:methionyl-tRNA synthetase
VIGKNILRFHAVFWPAILLSAGEPLPTDILVHDFLTANGRRLSKSSGNVVDPVALTKRYGSDALRWWLLREVQRVGETGFTVARLIARADEDLASGFGNLVNRVVALVHRYRDGRVPTAAVGEAGPTAERLLRACRQAPARVDEALAVGGLPPRDRGRVGDRGGGKPLRRDGSAMGTGPRRARRAVAGLG